MPKRIQSINPATGAVLAEFEVADTEQVATIVDRARQASQDWRQTSLQTRIQKLRALRKGLIQQQDALVQILVEEIGKPRLEACGSELLSSLGTLETLIKQGPRWIRSYRVRADLFDRLRRVCGYDIVREPVGVVGIIGTWNYPLSINLSQIASALLCGNTVVWKPSELSLQTATSIAALFESAGFPKDVFQMICGDGETGHALAKSGCDKILFTGSAQTGRHIMCQLAETGTPSVMELSGMDPACVRADADIQAAVQGIVWSSMTNAGQTCIATRRVYVHQQVAKDFKAQLVQAVQQLRLGDPQDPDVDVGPVRSQQLLETAETLVQDAKASGAELLTGGKRGEGAGFFFEPTVLDQVKQSMAIAQEAFFGPILLVQSVSSDTEMIALANDNPYALGASIWSRDLAQARQMASALQAGVVWINDAVCAAGDVRIPFGGRKASGFGRVHGREGLQELLATKSIQVSQVKGFRPYLYPYGQAKIDQIRDLLKWRYQ